MHMLANLILKSTKGRKNKKNELTHIIIVCDVVHKNNKLTIWKFLGKISSQTMLPCRSLVGFLRRRPCLLSYSKQT
jgi:hypothetical protein